METKDRERPFRLRPRRPPTGAYGESDRTWAHGLRRLLRIVQMSGRRGPGKTGFVRSAHAAKFHQRVAVRVTYSTNKTPGQWKAHGHYIARESATQKENIKAVGFSATETAVDVAGRLASWQSEGDERMFKIIVSPEFGEKMNLEKHTRDLMRRIEQSLITKLEWVAVVHHNTEHPHIHIALRGVDDRGTALRLPVRSSSQEFAAMQKNWQRRSWDFGQNATRLKRSAERCSNSGSQAWIESFNEAEIRTRTTSRFGENRLSRGDDTRKRRITMYWRD